MKRLAALAVSLLAAACAHTPQEVVESGTQHKTPITKPVDQAAECMRWNAENHASHLVASRQGNRVLVRIVSGMPTTLAVADLKPGEAIVYIWRDLLWGREDFVKVLTNGC